MAVVARYREPGLRYREPGLIYRGLVPGQGEEGFGLSQPHRPGTIIRIYDRDDLLQHQLSSNVQRPIVLDWKFELLDTGCGSFDLTLSKEIQLGHDWRVDFHLYNDPAPWYSGWLQDRPAAGGTERKFSLGGYGFFSMAEDVLVTATFPAGQRPSQIADALGRMLERQTGRRVIYSSGQIANSNYVTSGEIKFLRTDFKTAMKQICDLAGGYTWGVDERRRFFFRQESQAITDDSRWWVGKHLRTYVPVEDSSKIRNRIFVKLGKVRTDLNVAHPLFGTNFLEDPIEDADSVALYRPREMIYSASSLLSPTDAVRGAAIELARRARPTQKARVTGVEFRGRRILPDGLARVTGRGGAVLELPKKKITYEAEGSSIRCNVDLGEQDATPGSLLALITRAQAEESLNRQNSQSQIS